MDKNTRSGKALNRFISPLAGRSGKAVVDSLSSLFAASSRRRLSQISMRRCLSITLALIAAACGSRCTTSHQPVLPAVPAAEVVLTAKLLQAAPPHYDKSPLRLDGFFLETAQGQTLLPPQIVPQPLGTSTQRRESHATLPDGRVVTLVLEREGDHITLRLSAAPSEDIVRWGFALLSRPDEYFTGIMERVVDGPQQASWAPERTEGLNLRGQKIEMILKPTTSVYAPYYLSSRGYALFVRGNWPGLFDFCAADPTRVKVEFEGPTFEAKIYTAKEPSKLIVETNSLDGPRALPLYQKMGFTPYAQEPRVMIARD